MTVLRMTKMVVSLPQYVTTPTQLGSGHAVEGVTGRGIGTETTDEVEMEETTDMARDEAEVIGIETGIEIEIGIATTTDGETGTVIIMGRNGMKSTA